MKNENDYHGTKYTENKTPENIPPIPEDQITTTSRAPVGVFPVVRFKGNYGLFCSQYQEIIRHNITYNEARQLIWSFYGVCPFLATFLDSHGNVIHEEGTFAV